MGKPMQDRTPLTAYWTAIKSKNPDLKDPKFKPDINSPIGTYDNAMKSYTNFSIQRERLMDMFPPFFKKSGDLSQQINAQRAELDKILDRDQAQVDASVERVNTAIAKGENADPAEITGALTDLNTQAVDLVASRKTIWEQLSKLGETKNQGIKKVLDDYKGKVTTIANGMKKAEDDANKLETQIRAVITSYQRVATQMNKTDLVDGIRELLDRF
jgi:hypothetical protein